MNKYFIYGIKRRNCCVSLYQTIYICKIKKRTSLRRLYIYIYIYKQQIKLIKQIIIFYYIRTKKFSFFFKLLICQISQTEIIKQLHYLM